MIHKGVNKSCEDLVEVVKGLIEVVTDLIGAVRFVIRIVMLVTLLSKTISARTLWKGFRGTIMTAMRTNSTMYSAGTFKICPLLVLLL